MPRRRSRPSDASHRNAWTALFAGVRSALAGEPVPQAAKAFHRAAAFAAEPLEKRLLFTTIGFGTDPFTLLPRQADGTFEFIQGNPRQTIRVKWHNLTAELIPVQVDNDTGLFPDIPRVPTFADPVPDLQPPVATVPPNIPNLFTIYITHSQPDSWLSIAEVPDISTNLDAPRSEIPFTGNAGPFTINNAGTGKPSITFTPGGGSALLGNKFTAKFDKDIPVLEVPLLGGFGLYPGNPLNVLNPGVIMAATDTVGDGVNPAPNTPNDIGSFFFGGTITGEVMIPAAPAGAAVAPNSTGGNVGVFYAGNIFTGDATGIFKTSEDASSITPNFVVGGDLRSLLVGESIGGDEAGATRADEPKYLTGFRAQVGGKVGQIYARNGGFFGSVVAAHDPTVYGLPQNLFTDYEFEFKPQQGDNAGNVFEGLLEVDPLTLLAMSPRLSTFTNDTPATAQFLNPVRDVDPFTNLPLSDVSGNPKYVANVSGIFQGAPPARDRDDYYAIALLAGQSLTVTANTGLSAQVQILDPDGRIIGTDENQANPAQTLDQPFGITADRPGIYLIRVTNQPGVIDLFDFGYTLRIEGVGDLGLAAIAAPGAGGVIYDAQYGTVIDVAKGDLGAVFAGGNVISTSSSIIELDPFGSILSTTPPQMIFVETGNLRAIQAGSVGLLTAQGAADPVTGEVTAATFGAIPTINVPFGSVGLISGTDPLGVTSIQTQFDLATLTTPVTAIGGDFQIISGAGLVYLNIAADGGIGTLRAGRMSTLTPSFIEVNNDNIGFDGIIDLVDCAGNFGVLGGGPAFVTNQGGNIRYMRLGGLIFKDTFFGGTQILPILHPPGEIVSFTDDSGTPVTLTPIGPVTTTSVVNTDGTVTTTTTGPQLSIVAYPIRDKGGQVPVNITSTGGLTVSGAGAAGALSRVEFGTLGVGGLGPGVALGPADLNGNPTIIEAPLVTDVTTGIATSVDQPLTLNGPARVDVLDVVVGAGGNVTTIANNTLGEILSVTAGNIGTLSSLGDIGVAVPVATPAAVLPTNVLFGNAYPFIGERLGVTVTGSIVNLTAAGAIGNVSVGPGSILDTVGVIQNLTANSDLKTAPGHFDGIVGNVMTTRLLNASIGEGVLPSGSGAVSFAGLYATGKFGIITSPQLTYIRGNVIALENLTIPLQTGLVPIRAIDSINISGSIIGADIGTYTGFIQAQAINFGALFPQPTHVAGEFDIGSISVNGRGGILGSFIHGYNIGPIAVGRAGFGILQTLIQTVSNGHIGLITAGGYGIRQVSVSGGDNLDGLLASGTGAVLSVGNFPVELRASEFSPERDPFTHSVPTITTDLNIALGVTPGAGSSSVLDTGVIEDVVAQGGGDFGSLVAQKVRTSLPVLSPPIVLGTAPEPNIPKIGVTYSMALNFANAVGAIRVNQLIDGLQLTTGRLGIFAPSGSVSRLGISVAGTISKFFIRGNLGQTITSPATGLPIPDSYVQASGPNGSITAMVVSGSLFANVTANITIGSLFVGRDVLGSITASGQTTGLSLGILRVGGTIRDGALNISGSAGAIITSFGFGSSTGSLTVGGNLRVLSVGALHTRSTSALNLNLHVVGRLNTLMVYGKINGNVTVDGDLNTMLLISPTQGENALNGNLTVGGRLGLAAVARGNVNANVTVSGPIDRFLIHRGSVLANKTIQSNISSISNFRIAGGKAFGLFGNLRAPNGVGMAVDISGSVGDGANTAIISAFSGSVFRIGGSIATGSSIAITDVLNLLQVTGNIEGGAIISAHPLKKLIVGGANNGSVTDV